MNPKDYNKIITQTFSDYHSHALVDNFFTKKECELIVNSNKEFKKKDNITEKFKKNNLWIYEKLEKVIIDINNNYFKFDIDTIEELKLIEYNEDDFLSINNDIRNNSFSNRKLNIIVSLSHFSEYEGGNINFIPEINLKFNQGSLIVFPSYQVYEIEKILWGQKYHLIAYIHGPKFR